MINYLRCGQDVAYRQGVLDAVRHFAWWKDGEQQVGTSGTTLEDVKKQIEENIARVKRAREE